MPDPTRDQDAYRGRDDDVALNSAVWNGGAAVNTGWTQDVDVDFRIRFLIQGAVMTANNDTYELWFNLAGGGMEVMTATTALQPAPASLYANGDTTTQLLGSGTYAGSDSAGGVDDSLDTGLMDLVAGEELEAEWCLTIDGAQVTDEDLLLVQIREADGTAFDTYDNEMTDAGSGITINKVAAAGGPRGAPLSHPLAGSIGGPI